MQTFKLITLLAMSVIFLQSCKKEENDAEEQRSNHLTECPGKYEGQYMGNFVQDGDVIASNVRITVLTTVGNQSAITLVIENFNSSIDTILAAIECDLRSFTLETGLNGYGSFSEDGNTININYDDYWSNVQGIFTKTKNTGFVMLAPDRDTVIAGSSSNMQIQIRRFGDYNKQVTIKTESVYGGLGNAAGALTTSFNPSSGTPDYITTLNLSAPGTIFNSYYIVDISATDGAITEEHAITVDLINNDCTSFFNGYYSYDCWYFQTDTVSINAISPTQIQFSANLWYMGATITATINCAEGKITIPRHTVETDYEVQGTGTFYHNGTGVVMMINFDLLYNGSLEEECNAEFSLL